MVLFSGDLTIIQDSIIKISDKVSRDYIELENLQTSYKGSTQFTNMVVDYIKKKLYEYLSSKKPNYDICFQGEKVVKENSKANFRYYIAPLCGQINLSHAIPYFSISVALQKKQADNTYKTISGVIDNPITQETFIVEEGKGAYVNTRRIRVSARSKLDESLIVIKNSINKDFVADCVKKYKHIMVTNCEILNICNVANGKYDMAILEKSGDHQDLCFLLIKEAGGFIKRLDNGNIVVSNEHLYTQVK